MSRDTLTTARLVLRPFRADDVDDALAYRDDREFARYLPHIPQPFTREDAEAFVATNMTESWDTLPTFAVVLDGRVIGTVNLMIELEAGVAMIGYAIARAHWRRGIATEAATAVIAWELARHPVIEEIWATTDTGNIGSQRVMAKLGMVPDPARTGEREVGYRLVIAREREPDV